MDKGNERIAELVIQLQGGNNAAFNELYKLTSGRAYFVALEITKNEQDAEDILQESYVKMLEKIGSLDKPESFVSWFHHIVANKSKDSLKKKKPGLFEGGEDEAFEVIPDEDTSFSPEENLNQDELHSAVMAAIGELTEEKRACVMMMYFEEMSVNEISESLEIPVSTVKNRLFTARKDLKAKFEKRGITSLYSAAPIGVVIWALTRASDRVSTAFVQNGASARVLSGITVSGTAAAATAAATATTAATTAASAGAGAAAKAVVLTAAQKIVIGIAAAGIVGGTATGAVFTVNGIRTYNENKQKETLTVAQEEVTTAPEPESETALQALVTLTETSASTTESETTTAAVTTKPTTTAKKTTTTARPTTTAGPTTTKKPTTTRKPRTTKPTTTKKMTTTTKPTTTRRQTTTTTEPETEAPTTTEPTTTTQAPDAVLSVKVLDFDDSVVDEFTITVDPGTVLSHSNVFPLIKAKGHTPTSGIGGVSDSLVAQSGETYEIIAYL